MLHQLGTLTPGMYSLFKDKREVEYWVTADILDVEEVEHTVKKCRRK